MTTFNASTAANPRIVRFKRCFKFAIFHHALGQIVANRFYNCSTHRYVPSSSRASVNTFAEATRAAVQRLVALLNRLQIPAKDKELSWEPRQKQDFLGMQFNTMSERAGDGTAPCVEISLTADYRKYLQHQVSAVLERGSFEAATMARNSASALDKTTVLCCLLSDFTMLSSKQMVPPLAF